VVETRLERIRIRARITLSNGGRLGFGHLVAEDGVSHQNGLLFFDREGGKRFNQDFLLQDGVSRPCEQDLVGACKTSQL